MQKAILVFLLFIMVMSSCSLAFVGVRDDREISPRMIAQDCHAVLLDSIDAARDSAEVYAALALDSLMRKYHVSGVQVFSSAVHTMNHNIGMYDHRDRMIYLNSHYVNTIPSCTTKADSLSYTSIGCVLSEVAHAVEHCQWGTEIYEFCLKREWRRNFYRKEKFYTDKTSFEGYAHLVIEPELYKQFFRIAAWYRVTRTGTNFPR